MMAGIRGKNTTPELIMRRGLHGQGYRFRLHHKDLPGKPDLVLPRHNAVVLVNGCFWHGHDCSLFKWPKSREEFWRLKIGQNVARDIRNREALLALGWRQITIWECALKGKNRYPAQEVVMRCASWLAGGERTGDIRER